MDSTARLLQRPTSSFTGYADAMAVLSLSRSVIYEQIRSGRLRSVTQGRIRLIPASAIAEYVALLERKRRPPDGSASKPG